MNYMNYFSTQTAILLMILIRYTESISHGVSKPNLLKQYLDLDGYKFKINTGRASQIKIF